MSQFCRYIFFIFLFLGLDSGRAVAHGFDCNTPAVSFIDPVTHDFIVSDESGGGITWGRLDTCPVLQNLSGGSGDAACIGGSSVAVQSNMESFEAYIGCRSSVMLKFKLNFQNPNLASFLVLSAFPAAQNQWVPVSIWNNTVGTLSQGEEIQIELSPFSTDGFSPLKLRWEFFSSAGDTSFVQIDDVSLICVESEQSDVDVTIVGEIGPLPVGAIRRYKVIGKNLGPDATTLTNLSTTVSTSGKVIGALGAFTVAQSLSPLEINLGIEQQQINVPTEAFIDVRFMNLSDISTGAIPITAKIESDKCDFRLNNNERQRIVSVESNDTSIKFTKDLLKVQKLNLKLKKFSSCKGTVKGLNGMLNKITSPSAKERLKIMAPDYSASLVSDLNKATSLSRKITEGLASCGSKESKKAYKKTKQYSERLGILFLN